MIGLIRKSYAELVKNFHPNQQIQFWYTLHCLLKSNKQNETKQKDGRKQQLKLRRGGRTQNMHCWTSAENFHNADSGKGRCPLLEYDQKLLQIVAPLL